MNLEKIISNCIKHDRSSQRQLFESYKDAVYTVIYRVINNEDIAHDILQETFIKAFKNLKSLKEPKYFFGWIKTIAIRNAIKYQKKNIIIDDISIAEHKLANQNEPLGAEYIELLIQKLPRKARTIFLMIEIEGFAHKEVSEILNISIGTSKSQLNFAKTKLKKWLSPYLID